MGVYTRGMTQLNQTLLVSVTVIWLEKHKWVSVLARKQSGNLRISETGGGRSVFM
jgi:hypothetical protein